MLEGFFEYCDDNNKRRVFFFKVGGWGVVLFMWRMFIVLVFDLGFWGIVVG